MPRHRRTLAAAMAVAAAVAFGSASGVATSEPELRSANRPVLHAISPTAVPVGGGLIAVGGSRLNQVHSVSFGGIVVRKVHNVSATRLTVRTPKHALGQVAVVLHSGSGPSRTVYLNYVRPPAPLHWHADPGIDPHRGELTALSCVTENFCVAVEHDPNTPTRLLRFGTHIAPKTTEVPESAGVRTVGCGTNRFCVAGPATGAYIWNGSRWRGPIHLGNHLKNTPVCARGTATCLYYSSTRTLMHSRSGWKSRPLPTGLTVYDISCVSATFCEGLSYKRHHQGDHFVRYDGSSWQVDTAAPSVGYVKIACIASTYCLATGSDGSAEFNGVAWTRLGGEPRFRLERIQLGCSSPGHCVVLKKRFGSAAVFSGGQWSPSDLPNEHGDAIALSCPSGTLCRAADLQGRTFDLVNDTWSSVRQLVPAKGHLRDVSCASHNWCMAIDQSGNALRWRDGHWSQPRPISTSHGLIAISCSPERSCTAVNLLVQPDPDLRVQGQAIRFLHGHWQHPTLIDSTHAPTDVSCPSAGYCAVVDSQGRVIIFEHGGWSAPIRVFKVDSGRTIDCPAAMHCVTVGRGGTFVSTRDSWRRVPDPFYLHRVADVDCVDIGFCIAKAECSAFGTAFCTTSGFEMAELHAGVWEALTSHGAVIVRHSCASRTLCVGGGSTKDGPVEEMFNGSAVRRSRDHKAVAVTCAPGPLCIELSKYSALVGASRVAPSKDLAG